MSNWRKPLLVSIVATVLLYVGAVMLADFQRVKFAVLSLSPATWSAVLGLSLLNYVLRFLRWDAYLSHITQIEIPKLRHFVYYLAGFALATTPGKAGEA